MRTLLLIFVCFVQVVGALSIGAESPQAVEVKSSSALRVDELLAPWESTTAPGFSVAISLDGEVVYSQGVGLANLEYQLPIDKKSIFHVASVSKQFTAFSLHLLAAEGKVSLDDEVTKYLPDFPDLGSPITVRHLVSHTSGLRDQWTLLGMAGWRNDGVMTDAQIRALVSRQQGRNFAPGSRFEYSNTGYFHLAQIVERLSGQSLAEFSHSRIFQPLGMESTRFYDDHAQLVKNRAYSYQPTSQGFDKGNLNFSTVGPTGLMTTAEDLLKWADNFHSKKVHPGGALTALHERFTADDGQPAIFANGQEEREYHGLTTWSHGGRDAGYRAFLLRVPEARFAVAVLGNRGDLDAAEIAFAALEIYLADHPGYEAPEPEEWTPPTAAELKRFVGDFELFPGLIFSIRTDGENLLFSPLDQEDNAVPLPPIGPRRFALNPARSISLEFAPIDDGPSRRFDYRLGLNGSIPAPRVELKPFDPAGVDLKSFEGRFFSEELGTSYEFRIENGVLVAVHPRFEPLPMSPYQRDLFATSENRFQKIEFVRNAEGVVIGALVSGVFAERVKFDKQPPRSSDTPGR